MITLWSIICAIVAGIDLGYSLGYFIKEQNIGNGIFWLVLFLLATYSSISSIVKQGRLIQYQMEQQQENNNEGDDE